MGGIKVELTHTWALHETRGNAEGVDTQSIVPVVRLETLEDVIESLADECFENGDEHGRQALEQLERLLRKAVQ
jgi:hypothetical protein